MDEKEVGGKSSSSPMKKYFVVGILVLFVLVLAGGGIVKVYTSRNVCGDGTSYNSCSSEKPYFCDSSSGMLVEKSSICGCPDNFSVQAQGCMSNEFQTGPKNITLNYILDGQKGEINFTVYKGLYDYLSSLKKSIVYNSSSAPSRVDFELKSINEPNQEQMLLPLIAKIQNLYPNSKADQFRVAASLVQSIPYGNSNKTVNFFGSQIDYSRYPYEVLYDHQGVCGEKSQLLAYLLRGLGYDTVLFYYPVENHEAIGVKCPADKGVGKTGYCFVETSGRAIPTDNSLVYAGGIKLNSDPQVFKLSSGISLPWNMNEYSDAKLLKKIRNGDFVLFRDKKLAGLEKKYGLNQSEYGLV